jgi:hypothetical protein
MSPAPGTTLTCPGSACQRADQAEAVSPGGSMPQPPLNSGAQRSLPEAVAVRRLAVPDSAPPYDDDRDTFTSMNAPQGAPAARRAQPSTPTGRDPAGGMPAGDHPAPADDAAGDRAAPHVPAAPPSGGPHPPEPAGDRAAPHVPAAPPSSGPHPPESAGAWPGQFAQVLAETLAGSRAQGQIVPWTSDQARRRIRQLRPMLAAGTVPRVRRVMTTCPAAGVVEMTVVVGFGPRVRALAVRLEERDEPPHRHTARHVAAPRWVCTAIEAA